VGRVVSDRDGSHGGGGCHLFENLDPTKGQQGDLWFEKGSDESVRSVMNY
jgi:hypothetical protein